MTTATLTTLDNAMGRYADGDDAVFPLLFSRLAPRLRLFLRGLCGSADLAEDLAQETLMRVHRSRQTFARDRRALPWVYTIARNCFLRYASSLDARAARRSADVTEHEVSAGAGASAEAAAVARESERAVDRALRQMSPANRDAFLLVRVEGMSCADAARALGVSEGAVKLRVFRASGAIRSALGLE